MVHLNWNKRFSFVQLHYLNYRPYEDVYSILLLMKKNRLLTLVAGILFFTQNLNAQYTELSGKELESTIYMNHKNGLPNNNGLFTILSFKVKDFSLLSENYQTFYLELEKRFKVELFELNNDQQQLNVIYVKSTSSTDDFLKILKEVLSEKGVFLTGYDERILIKTK